ncbi:putative acetyltransferase [Abditibacteriota bacterium]|nr:putative acetyltransferase [Abditibacteriota bacterium]
MNRIRSILGRYGTKTPFVVLDIGFKKLTYWKCMAALGWLRLTTLGTKGKRIAFGQDVSVSPGGYLKLGDGLYIGDRCIFEIYVNPKAHIVIGSETWISHDCHLSSCQEIKIGNKVLIGEFVSIRDSTHSHSKLDVPIKDQTDVLGAIYIEDDVWIGRGCLILGRPEGVSIGMGAIIAANSVVSRSIPPLQIWGGVPARFIAHRDLNSAESNAHL